MVWFALSRVCGVHDRRRARNGRTLLLATAALASTGCATPALDWIDEAPARTGMPSPLAHPPYVAPDSTLADSSALAAFLLTQDRLREAGAHSLLTGLTAGLPEAADTTAVTAPVAKPGTTVTAPNAPAATATPMASMPGMDHSAHVMPAAAAAAGPLGSDDAPRDEARCARTLRLAAAPGFGTVAVWWTRATGGRVHLVAAWRDGQGDSGAWRGPLPVDTLDQGPGDAQAAERGAHGCVRPAPSVAWDARTNFLHVAYAVRGPEGPGVFYAHQMDPRASFETPVAVLYGEQLGQVRVSSDGDVVAVAYEDPNTRGRSRVGVAISRTAGHTFEEQRLIASADAAEARDPYVVVHGRAVVLGWSDVAVTPSSGAAAAASRADAEPVFVTRRLRVRR
jgi:hypothetical protein